MEFLVLGMAPVLNIFHCSGKIDFLIDSLMMWLSVSVISSTISFNIVTGKVSCSITPVEWTLSLFF